MPRRRDRARQRAGRRRPLRALRRASSRCASSSSGSSASPTTPTACSTTSTRSSWPEHVKTMQRNWIGRSEGAEVVVPLRGAGHRLPGLHDAAGHAVRRDVLRHGARAPRRAAPRRGHRARGRGARVRQPRADRADRGARRRRQGEDRRRRSGARSPTPSTASSCRCTSPTTCSWSTAPARSWPCPRTTSATSRSPRPSACRSGASIEAAGDELPYTGDGPLVNSHPEFDGLHNREALDAIVAWLDREGKGHASVNYRLRDWLLSRQRYWGCPIPIIHCDRCGARAGARGRAAGRAARRRGLQAAGPLAAGRRRGLGRRRPARRAAATARRETDTMDTFVDSSWYFLRYCDAGNDEAAWDPAVVAPLDAGRPVHRRRRARDPAPALRALLHEGAGRPRPPPDVQEPFAAPLHPGHDHQGRREDVQVQGQRRLAQDDRRALRRRHRALPTSSSSARPTRTPTGPTAAWRACTASSRRLWRLSAEAADEPARRARSPARGRPRRATTACCARRTGRSRRSRTT